MNDNYCIRIYKDIRSAWLPIRRAMPHSHSTNHKYAHSLIHIVSLSLSHSVWSHFIQHHCICCMVLCVCVCAVIVETNDKRPLHSAVIQYTTTAYCLFVCSFVAAAHQFVCYFVQIFELPNGNAQWHCSDWEREGKIERERYTLYYSALQKQMQMQI